MRSPVHDRGHPPDDFRARCPARALKRVKREYPRRACANPVNDGTWTRFEVAWHGNCPVAGWQPREWLGRGPRGRHCSDPPVRTAPERDDSRPIGFRTSIRWAYWCWSCPSLGRWPRPPAATAHQLLPPNPRSPRGLAQSLFRESADRGPNRPAARRISDRSGEARASRPSRPESRGDRRRASRSPRPNRQPQRRRATPAQYRLRAAPLATRAYGARRPRRG